MSVTVTLNAATKRLTFSGPIAGGSTEVVSVTPALSAGSLRVFSASRVRVAECAISGSAGSLVTTGSALLDLLADVPVCSAGMPFDVSLYDASDNLLGSGRAAILANAAAGSEAVVPVGGPLTLAAGEDIPAGAPLRILSGELRICTASNAAGFVGIAEAAALTGANCTAARWGAVTVAGWGLTAGAVYYLPQTGGALTADLTDVNIVRPVGIATDAATLLLIGGGLSVQAGATGTASYLVWDADAKRLVALSAAQAGGAGNANKLLALDASGMIPASAVPAAVTAAALAAVRALFADMLPLTDPSSEELTVAVNQLVSRLKG